MSHKLLYLVAVLGGLLLGWTLSGTFNSQGSIEPAELKQVNQSLNEVSAEQKSTPTAQATHHELPLESPEAETPNEQAEWTTATLISHVNNIDSTAWEALLRSRQFEQLSTQSPELVKGLLGQYLDLPQPARARVFALLYNAEFSQIRFPRDANKFNLVDWVVTQVKNEQRSSEWLQFLSQTGVHEEQHINYLLDRTGNFQPDRDTAAILKAVAGSFGSSTTGGSEQEMKAISAKLENFRESSNDEIRAAAIQSLQSFPSDNQYQHINNALQDQSSLVRQAAYGVAMNNATRSQDLQDRLLAAMRNQDYPDQERLTAYQYLSSGFTLNEEAYQQVYDFSQQELAVLRARYAQQYRSEGGL